MAKHCTTIKPSGTDEAMLISMPTCIASSAFDSGCDMPRFSIGFYLYVFKNKNRMPYGRVTSFPLKPTLCSVFAPVFYYNPVA
jgi:hypothetical protein